MHRKSRSDTIERLGTHRSDKGTEKEPRRAHTPQPSLENFWDVLDQEPQITASSSPSTSEETRQGKRQDRTDAVSPTGSPPVSGASSVQLPQAFADGDFSTSYVSHRVPQSGLSNSMATNKRPPEAFTFGVKMLRKSEMAPPPSTFPSTFSSLTSSTHRRGEGVGSLKNSSPQMTAIDESSSPPSSVTTSTPATGRTKLRPRWSSRMRKRTDETPESPYSGNIPKAPASSESDLPTKSHKRSATENLSQASALTSVFAGDGDDDEHLPRHRKSSSDFALTQTRPTFAVNPQTFMAPTLRTPSRSSQKHAQTTALPHSPYSCLPEENQVTEVVPENSSDNGEPSTPSSLRSESALSSAKSHHGSPALPSSTCRSPSSSLRRSPDSERSLDSPRASQRVASLGFSFRGKDSPSVAAQKRALTTTPTGTAPSSPSLSFSLRRHPAVGDSESSVSPATTPTSSSRSKGFSFRTRVESHLNSPTQTTFDTAVASIPTLALVEEAAATHPEPEDTSVLEESHPTKTDISNKSRIDKSISPARKPRGEPNTRRLSNSYSFDSKRVPSPVTPTPPRVTDFGGGNDTHLSVSAAPASPFLKSPSVSWSRPNMKDAADSLRKLGRAATGRLGITAPALPTLTKDSPLDLSLESLTAHRSQHAIRPSTPTSAVQTSNPNDFSNESKVSSEIQPKGILPLSIGKGSIQSGNSRSHRVLAPGDGKSANAHYAPKRWSSNRNPRSTVTTPQARLRTLVRARTRESTMVLPKPPAGPADDVVMRQSFSKVLLMHFL